MQSKPYLKELLNNLRNTLRDLEGNKLTDADDPDFAELKAHIKRTLRQYEAVEY